VKVGVSNDPLRRLAQLNSGQAPFPLYLVACWADEDAYGTEKALRENLLADHKTHGEWFNFNPAAYRVMNHMTNPIALAVSLTGNI
jgi:hypothetical protein